MTYYEEASKCAYQALDLYRRMNFSVAPFYKPEMGFDKFNEIVLSELYTALYTTGESILILANYGDIWENDMLLRSLSEGTIKYVYMMQENLTQKSPLIDEYYNIIPEFQKLRDHEAAIEAMKMYNKLGVNRHPFEISILSEDELKCLNTKYSQCYITKVSKKWSYRTILHELMKKDDKYEVLTTTFYSYSFSSHLMHYDGECLRNRAGSLQNNNEQLDIAHLRRIVSNVLGISLIRVSEYIRVYRIRSEEVASIINEALEFIDELENLNNEALKDKY